MAKYYGRAGCGHDYKIELYGPYKMRHQRLEWMNSEDGMCNKCYHQMMVEREKKAKEANKEV